MLASPQATSPIGFLSLKLPPPPCAVLAGIYVQDYKGMAVAKANQARLVYQVVNHIALYVCLWRGQNAHTWIVQIVPLSTKLDQTRQTFAYVHP